MNVREENWHILKTSVNMLPQLSVGEIILRVVQIVGIALDHVFASNEIVHELVNFYEVHPVFVDVNVATICVVGWTNEDTHNSIKCLVTDNIDLVSERFVVQTLLSCADVPVVTLVLFVVDIHGLLDLGIEVFEVSYQAVDDDVFNLDSGDSDVIIVVFS